MDLITVLSKTISSDHNELEAAERFLQQAAQTNFAEFLKSLSEVICNVSNQPIVRTAAGLQLKNALTSKDENLRLQYQQRWLQLPEEIRNYIKRNVVSALGTESARPSSAAQCVAYIAVTELPHNLWPDVIRLLTQNVTNSASTEIMKEATLEAIGYICQDIEPEILVSQSNEILTAIVHGMRKDEPSNHVKLAATNALYNSLEFTKANFDKDSERHFIMQVVCEATQSENIPVRVAALQCLVKIMSLYYQYMEHYMGPALFAITLQAMKSDVDEIALQGIEFWSNVCDEEVDLAIELSEATEQGRPPTKTSRHYAKGALQYLVPTLTHCLTKQDEHDDEDDWNPSKAAGVCLVLMASCCEDAIIPHVLPFVNENIKNPDWRYREAAVMAFGSILEGPDPGQLKPIVEQALPMLIELMNDKCVVVRDTVAWTIGRVCELIPEAILTDALGPLLETLVKGLESEPRVASNVCWAFNSLAEAAYESAEKEDDGEPKTYVLSKYFEFIVSKLLETTERPDANQANLRSSAYEALMELIKNSPRDCYVIIQKITMVILNRLQQVLQLENYIQSTSDRSQYNDLQSLLWATFQSILRKMTPEDALQISDAVMSALLQMFESSGKTGGVQEDALMAVGTLVETIGEGFLKYMDAFRPVLAASLKNHADYQVCNAAVGLVEDICRAIGIKILPYCDEIMTLLMANLSDTNVNRSVKPLILSAFGDIALAIGPEFSKYLDVVLTALMHASQLQVDKNDYDLVDYLNELRENCLEAYTGIVQGLKGDKESPNPDVHLLSNHVSYINQFIIVVASDPDITDSLIAACAGLIGDLVSAFGQAMLPLAERDEINQLLVKGKRSKASKTRTLSIWAHKELRKIRGNVQ
ncbi:importin subunit beta-1-like protein [Dinothrombium tinctorium]|uniref:Importin subunit beta-1-like protein n=1 Tax=Dinothrombium tinctorium TaxID=1965070 RepID=A0A3S3PW20_9ACAR|nr:importin subunit beta-1-like protein [Dinothrombium tinctorium]